MRTYNRTAPRESVADRLARNIRVDPSTGCHVFIGRLMPNGYARIQGANLKRVPAHRAAYEIASGPVPDGLQLDHLCRNRACCNPAHLEAVTPRENTLRGQGPAAVNARRTHCPAGHEYTPDNTYVIRTGGRRCKACVRLSARRPSGEAVSAGNLAPDEHQ